MPKKDQKVAEDSSYQKGVGMGIIIHDHDFASQPKESFYQGRRRSLEWNYDIAKKRYDGKKKKKRKSV